MNELKPFITERDGIPVTTSRAVAEQFGKSHKHVLEAIDNLTSQLISADQDCNEEIKAVDSRKFGRETDSLTDFARANFELISSPDSRGKEQPVYLLTRDGFTLLAMGFTGTKALQFKVAYINAFNRMEMLLRGGLSSNALLSIENRLQALEKTAGEGKTDAIAKLSARFIKALQNAVDSGKYTLEHKYKQCYSDTSKILGLIDHEVIAIKSILAYRIFKAATKKPITRYSLWAVLEQSGIIKRRGQVRIKGEKYTVIYIAADKLLRREGEGDDNDL